MSWRFVGGAFARVGWGEKEENEEEWREGEENGEDRKHT
jgi:hypothetical protein